jgi:hypothetical protein
VETGMCVAPMTNHAPKIRRREEVRIDEEI